MKNDRIAAKIEVPEKMIEDVNQGSEQFITKLKGKKIVIRLISGGQPVTGVIVSHNLSEFLLQTAKGQILVFKHAIATIELMEELKSYKPN